MKRWDVACVLMTDQHLLDAFLARGWEPFAVSDGRMWLRLAGNMPTAQDEREAIHALR